MTEQKNKPAKTKDSEFSLTPVPASRQTQGLWAAMAVLVGFTFFAPSMTAGGNLGLGLTLTGFILAVALGNAFLGLYCGTLAHIGQKTALSYDLLAHHSFGSLGSYFPSAIISFTQAGWFGVGVAMFAIPVAELLGLPVWIVVAFAGFVMTLTAYFGIKSLAVLGSIAVPLIAILGTYSVIWGVDHAGGFGQVFSNNPEQPITLAAGITIVVGSFISGGTSTPNFARFSKTNKIAIVATVTAFFIGNSVMMIFGAIGGATMGVADIFSIMILQGLMIPAIITLGFNIWASNNHALYTAGLGVSNITKAPMKPMVVVAGVIGTVASLWLYYNFVTYLGILSGIIPPIGAVLIVHYFLNKSEYFEKDYHYEKVNLGSIIAVVCGTLMGLFLPWGVAPVNSLVTAGLISFLWERFGHKKRITSNEKGK
ncbi:MAG: cytosine permease [Coriobacteriales bacterium]|jgi:cytosine permease|nr:cytosine permease [Coriobacteriales bacterium]